MVVGYVCINVVFISVVGLWIGRRGRGGGPISCRHSKR